MADRKMITSLPSLVGVYLISSKTVHAQDLYLIHEIMMMSSAEPAAVSYTLLQVPAMRATIKVYRRTTIS